VEEIGVNGRVLSQVVDDDVEQGELTILCQRGF
jgi:hypothetical protein